MFQDLHIFDVHSHFPVKNSLGGIGGGKLTTREPGPIENPARVARLEEDNQALERVRHNWRLAFDFPEPESGTQSADVQAKRWVAELDKYGIEKIGFVTGGGNDELAKVCAEYPDRFIGYAHFDITQDGAAEELERAVTELGLRGLKLLAPTIPILINDKSLYPVWEACERLGIPALIHFGMLGAAGGVSYHPNISPAVLEPVARDFPTVNFIIPHFGIQHVTDLLFLCWSCPNVVVDSSGSNQWVRWMPYNLTLDDLFRKFYETIGPERILFGSDSSWFPRGFALRYLQDQLRICRFMNMPHEHLQMIFGGNAARLLNVSLGEIDVPRQDLPE
ncbi:MAG TPA: amidohydrolase family protein [Thermomicrobiales bacterium]|nr:amidohydrolase family protein [Thermomicrobiales bacterium]